MVDLQVGGAPALFIVLAADGTINRMGDGLEDCQERRLCIGVSNGEAFERVRQSVTSEMLAACGRSFGDPHASGASCTLCLIFKMLDGSELAMKWLYGSLSQGPPREVTSLVGKAVDETEVWYRAALPRAVSAAEPSERTQPWWRRWLR